jgi:hypothetical protein
MRVPNNRSSEMRLHLNRVGTRPIVAVIRIARYPGSRRSDQHPDKFSRGDGIPRLAVQIKCQSKLSLDWQIKCIVRQGLLTVYAAD